MAHKKPSHKFRNKAGSSTTKDRANLCACLDDLLLSVNEASAEDIASCQEMFENLIQRLKELGDKIEEISSEIDD